MQNAVGHQIAQPDRQNVFCESQASLKFAETAQAVESVANDEQGPPVADGIERSGHSTQRIGVSRSFDHSPVFQPETRSPDQHRRLNALVWLQYKTEWDITQRFHVETIGLKTTMPHPEEAFHESIR